MTWADLFERAKAYETDVETIREALAARREAEGTDAEERNGAKERNDEQEDHDA